MTKKKSQNVHTLIDGKTVALGFALGGALKSGKAYGYKVMYISTYSPYATTYYPLEMSAITSVLGGVTALTSTLTGDLELSSTFDAPYRAPVRTRPQSKPTPKPPPTGPGGDDPTEEEPFSAAGALLQSALLHTQADLGMHMRLLSASPTAFAQFSEDLSKGSGTSVEALVAVTGVEIPVMQKAWSHAGSLVPTVDSPESARRFINIFVQAIVPQIEVRPTTKASLAWRMIRERERHTVESKEEGSLSTHVWMAGWLGVSTEALVQATGNAVSALESVENAPELRALIYAEPHRFFDELTKSLSRDEYAALNARIEQIRAKQLKMWGQGPDNRGA